MLIVPLQARPNQTLSVLLANQNCQLNVYQKTFGLFMDVLVDGAIVCSGVQCLDRNLVIRYRYNGFVGDFLFFDLLGIEDPDYTGLGDRFQLAYAEAADLAEG